LQSTPRDCIAIKGLGFESIRFIARIFAKILIHRAIIDVDISDDVLNLFIRIPLGGFFFEDKIT